MEKFKVKVMYSFTVEYDFTGPKNVEEALEWANKHVAMTTAGLTTSLPEDKCDWNVDVHGKKTILRAIKDK